MDIETQGVEKLNSHYETLNINTLNARLIQSLAFRETIHNFTASKRLILRRLLIAILQLLNNSLLST